MSQKRKFIVANATRKPILVKVSDDVSTIVTDLQEEVNVGAGASCSSALPVFPVKAGVRHTRTVTKSTELGYVTIAPNDSYEFRDRKYVTIKGMTHKPIDAPTKFISLIVTSTGLKKSGVLSCIFRKKPTHKKIFTDTKKICHAQSEEVGCFVGNSNEEQYEELEELDEELEEQDEELEEQDEELEEQEEQDEELEEQDEESEEQDEELEEQEEQDEELEEQEEQDEELEESGDESADASEEAEESEEEEESEESSGEESDE